MRCVDKGAAPRAYSSYQDARNDLAERLGWYCSYCEMPILNMPEVEHVVPRANEGDPLAWANFLLACKYCNTNKNNNNRDRTGYLWPDIDNTSLAFEYGEAFAVRPAHAPYILDEVERFAQNDIDLMGLARFPGGLRAPTKSDSRWIHRAQVWIQAKWSRQNWDETSATPFAAQMAEQIAIAAAGFGFYSVWMVVFADAPNVLDEINASFRNTYLPIFQNGHPVQRQPESVF
jgi:hypothetical protein